MTVDYFSYSSCSSTNRNYSNKINSLANSASVVSGKKSLENNNGVNRVFINTLNVNKNNLNRIKEKIGLFRKATELNNEFNNEARNQLVNLIGSENINSCINSSAKINNNSKKVFHSTRASSNKLDLFEKNGNSKIRQELRNYVNYRHDFLKHANYWQKCWLFTDNPIYEYEKCEGFENPTYTHLNSLHTNRQNSTEETSTYYLNQLNLLCELENNSLACMNDIYEKILEQNQNRIGKNLDEYYSYMQRENCLMKKFSTNSKAAELDSSDSGIHSRDENSSSLSLRSSTILLSNSASNHTNISANNITMDNKVVSQNSLFSTLTDSGENLNNCHDVSSCGSKLNESSEINELKEERENFLEETINHLEQHELPLGWVKCCDDEGIYYWHKPTGTVTRKPPCVSKSTNDDLNCTLNDYNQLKNPIENENKKLSNLSSSSTASSSSSSTTSNSFLPHQTNLEKNTENTYLNNFDLTSTSNPASSASSTTSSHSSASSTLDNKLQNTTRTEKQLAHSKSSTDQFRISNNNDTQAASLRFYVRSLGWIRIDENDLTPEKSSKAVNKCINDLSRGLNDFNDSVARWGEGKDLYLDIQDNDLILIDPIDEKILNKQPIGSIRVWGVGRENNRDFAYVSKDKQTKIFMCHVLRCDSAPAKEIANALRDTCRQILNEKEALSSSIQAKNSNLIKRPINFLNDFINETNSNENKKIDINYKMKSISFCNDSNNSTTTTMINSANSKSSNLNSTSDLLSSNSSLLNSHSTVFLAPMEEPKKAIRCKYLGSIQVNKPSGMNTLNDAIEQIYQRSFDEYKKAKKEKQLRRKRSILMKQLDDLEDPSFSDINIDDEDIDEYECDLNENSDTLDDIEDNTAITFDNLLDVKTERKLGIDAEVIISPSTITVKKSKQNSSDLFNLSDDDEDNILAECRIRYLCFMGISADIRLCGFIMHQVDNTFRCHGFLCDESSGPLCKTIEAACKLRFQKCLDAHPEKINQMKNSESQHALSSNKNKSRFNLFGIIDSLRTKNLFGNSSS